MKLHNCRFLCALTLFVIPILTAQTAIAQTSVTWTGPIKTASWIDLQARTNKTQYATGEPIKVTLTATNIQTKDAYLKFSSGQRFDLQLFASGSQESLYMWSANKMFVAASSHVKLKQGQSETYDATIGSEMGELKPGKYRLEAQLSNSSQLHARPLEFTVVARPSAANEAGATLTATTDKTIYKIGEVVNITFDLQNKSKNPITLDLNSGQSYDVFVENAEGEQVWNWAANKRFAMMLRQVTLAAGETQNFAVQWDGRALTDEKIAPGKYFVKVVYTSNPAIRAAPIEIEIR